MLYLFITNCIEQKEVSTEYCPTEEMNGDYFTKPLQLATLRRHRAAINNLED